MENLKMTERLRLLEPYEVTEIEEAQVPAAWSAIYIISRSDAKDVTVSVVRKFGVRTNKQTRRKYVIRLKDLIKHIE